LRQYGQCMSAAPFPVSIVWLTRLLQHPAPTVSARPGRGPAGRRMWANLWVTWGQPAAACV